MSPTRNGESLETNCSGVSRASRGFTLIEVLLGMTILMVGLLGIAAMFPMAFITVHDAGKMTMGLTAARQILEDVRSVPFDEIINLNSFDTNNASTLPTNPTPREVARRWRYALAGEGNGFTYTTDEKSRWASLSSAGATFGARGRITVVAVSATLNRVTVTVTIPRRTRDLQITTLISRI